jgi:hypothetical protein
MTELLNKNNGLVLNNYKEPLKKVPEPYHGYEGATMVTQDGTKMQCHICGELYESVGRHAYFAHKINAKAYKKKFGLRMTTSLTSEKERERKKMAGIRWFNSLTAKERSKRVEEARARWRKIRHLTGNRKRTKISLESMNLKGTCPDQIAYQITKCAAAIGHTPSPDEFSRWAKSSRFVHLAYYRFGNWTKTLAYAKLKPRAKFTEKGKPRRKRYSDEELLEELIVFNQETGRVPSETDCKLGLLPSRHTYKRRFGSLRKARMKAGIQDEPKGKHVSPFGNGLLKTGYKTNLAGVKY